MAARRAIRRAALSVGGAGAVACHWLQRNFEEASQSNLQRGATVAVVGSGVVGVTTAYELARTLPRALLNPNRLIHRL